MVLESALVKYKMSLCSKALMQLLGCFAVIGCIHFCPGIRTASSLNLGLFVLFL